MSNFEWYTPPFLADAARKVLGKIDLDPASCDEANKVVHAEKFFSLADDGLQHEWRGRIFLNPPFKRWLVDKFIDKLLCSDVDAAVALTNASTDSQWFQRLALRSDGVCFLTGRIKFLQPDGNASKLTAKNGCCVFYLGSDVELFFEVFQPLGLCTQFNLPTQC